MCRRRMGMWHLLHEYCNLVDNDIFSETTLKSNTQAMESQHLAYISKEFLKHKSSYVPSQSHDRSTLTNTVEVRH
jgi:hypothetical protein